MLDQVRRLARLPARRRVASLLEGDYLALHPGRSTEFADLREYVRGDDPKDLDWKASARTRTLLVRRFEALRKLHVLLVVPTGRSLRAASTVETPKVEVVVAVAGLVGFLVVRHGDLVALVHGDRDRQAVTPSRGGAVHVERLLETVVTSVSRTSGESDLTVLLRKVTSSVRRRSFVVVVTDAAVIDDEATSALRRLLVQHEVVVALIGSLDPLSVDVDSPSAVTDVDSGHAVPSWLRDDPQLREQHDLAVTEEQEMVRRRLDDLGIAHVRVANVDDALPALRDLLDRHRRGSRR